MPRRLPKYCVEDPDRYGNVRVYFRRPGVPKVRLHGVAWTPAFMEQYERALKGDIQHEAVANHRGKPNTWRWLCQQYFQSVEFSRLTPDTQTVRRRILEATFDEPIRPDAQQCFGDMPVGQMTRKAIKVLRDRKASTPEAANARLKAIRRVFAYAIEEHDILVENNPSTNVSRIKTVTEGFHAWSEDEVRQYLRTHQAGSKARRALLLLLYTGARRSDVVKFGRQMVRDGWLRFQPQKTRKVSANMIEVPVLRPLASELLLGPQDNLTFLVTEYGKPFTSNGFGNKFKDWCREAGLGHCSAHGLRKAGATFAAENGATVHQLMAMYGWRSTQMAELYTRKARQRRLAGSGMALIEFEHSEDKSVPLLGAVGQSEENLQ